MAWDEGSQDEDGGGGVVVRRLLDILHSLIPSHGMRSSSIMLITDRKRLTHFEGLI